MGDLVCSTHLRSGRITHHIRCSPAIKTPYRSISGTLQRKPSKAALQPQSCSHAHNDVQHHTVSNQQTRGALMLANDLFAGAGGFSTAGSHLDGKLHNGYPEVRA